MSAKKLFGVASAAALMVGVATAALTGAVEAKTLKASHQ